MQVHSLNNTNFQSRNRTIRFADDIARRVNQCYPRISLSTIKTFDNAKLYPSLINNITKKLKKNVRKTKSNFYDDADSFCKKIKAFISPVKHNGIGNCGESAQLASIVAKVNGIKDCNLVNLYTAEGKDLDHTVLFVYDDKPYIIDSWLGFADYFPNTLNKYKTLYKNIFDNIKPDDNITFISYTDDEYTDFLKNNFTRKQINKLKKIYPEQFIRRGYT